MVGRIHYDDKGTNILGKCFINFLNYFVLNTNQNNQSINKIWLSTAETKLYVNQNSDNSISAGSLQFSRKITQNSLRENYAEFTNLEKK